MEWGATHVAVVRGTPLPPPHPRQTSHRPSPARTRSDNRSGESTSVATRGRADTGKRPRARTASVVVPFPRPARGDRLDLVRFVPTGRSLLTAFAIVAFAAVAYFAARETGVFAVQAVAVTGAPPAVAGQVRGVLRDAEGQSLVALDLDAASTAVEALPTVARVRFDRAYPHTLRVVVVPERPVAVVRQGARSFLVSERGRVVARVDRGARAALARVWVPRTVTLVPGATVTGDLRTAIGAVAPIAGARFPGRVTSVTAAEDALTLRLRSGLELRLGDAVETRLKLAVAAKLLPLLQPGSTYLDVSVPERPVAGTGETQPQVEVETLPSTIP
jgi:cell division protein FtsQ